jgi:hypothetical protein
MITAPMLGDHMIVNSYDGQHHAGRPPAQVLTPLRS